MIHGKRSTYVNHACRCPACKQANTEYQARIAPKNRVYKITEHGTQGSYRGGCRCDDCKEAHSRADRIARGGTAPKNAIPKYGTVRSTGHGMWLVD